MPVISGQSGQVYVSGDNSGQHEMIQLFSNVNTSIAFTFVSLTQHCMMYIQIKDPMGFEITVTYNYKDSKTPIIRWTMPIQILFSFQNFLRLHKQFLLLNCYTLTFLESVFAIPATTNLKNHNSACKWNGEVSLVSLKLPVFTMRNARHYEFQLNKSY